MYLTYDELRYLIGDPVGSDVAWHRDAPAPQEREAALPAPASRLDRHGHRASAQLPVLGQLGIPRPVLPDRYGWRTRSVASVAPRVSSKGVGSGGAQRR